MPSARCVRCGALARGPLCGPCLDYLVAYRPLWLDPALLPGPSLLDLVGVREVALVSADLSQLEWHTPSSEPAPADAVRLVRLLALDADAHPAMSVGDAEILHSFLRDGRRSTPTDPDERAALAAICRYLAARDWMPPHLASEYGVRAELLQPTEPPVEPPAVAVVRAEPVSDPSRIEAESLPPFPESTEEIAAPSTAPSEPALPDLEPIDLEETPLPAPEPFPPEPIPEPEPPLPLPEPIPQPEPQPEPEPEPEEAAGDPARLAELEAMKRALEKERGDVEAWVRSRSEELRAKEELLAGREETLASKEHEVEAQSRAATERLVALEKDMARREVLQFLGTVPGMSEPEADVIATAFPDLASLRAADVKALTQCRGVTEALARAIRYEIVPGEVDEEERTTRLREEAQSFLEEGDYKAALVCYDRLLRERPEETSVWFDRAELLVLLDRAEEALACYTHVLDQDRSNRQAWFERANLLFGIGRLADAVDALRETLRIDPSKSGDIVLKAEQLRRDGHPNEAVVLFQAVLDVHPAEPRAALGLGDSFLDLGDADAAEALFTRALGKNPQNAPIVFRKGELLERKGRWGAAIQYYNRAIALQWSFADAWLAKGKILLDHDRAGEALECFDKAVSFDPDRVDGWAGKARAHAALGDRDAATRAIERAAKANPDDPSVRAAREAIGLVAGSAEKAPAASEAAIDFPALAKAFEEIEEEPAPGPDAGPSLADLGSFVESIEPEKEETHVLVQLAELALEGGDPQMALLRYEQAIEREARNADAWTGKGVALQHLERYRDALDAYDRALSIRPDHELARKWRATCARRLEQGDQG